MLLAFLCEQCTHSGEPRFCGPSTCELLNVCCSPFFVSIKSDDMSSARIQVNRALQAVHLHPCPCLDLGILLKNVDGKVLPGSSLSLLLSLSPFLEESPSVRDGCRMSGQFLDFGAICARYLRRKTCQAY